VLRVGVQFSGENTMRSASVRSLGLNDALRAKRLEDGIKFGTLLHDVSRLRRVVADRELRKMDITWAQWSVLAFLSRRDGMSQTALAADLDLTKVAIGSLLDRMEVAGLVQRRVDETDARSRRVYLTRAGCRKLDRVHKQIEKFSPYIMRRVTDQELSITLQVLERVKQTLLELIGEGSGNQPPKNIDRLTIDA
jgi:DNA-binding MarR family transcriptional regulator